MIRFTYRSIKLLVFNKYVLIGLILSTVFIAGIFANNKVFVYRKICDEFKTLKQ